MRDITETYFEMENQESKFAPHLNQDQVFMI